MAKVIEEWKPVVGFEGLYEVSNTGRVRSLTRYKKVIKPIVTNSGYYQYQLWHNSTCRTGLAHRLVAQYTKDGKFLRNWKSASERARTINIPVSGIRRVVTGERKTAGGFVFKEVTS